MESVRTNLKSLLKGTLLKKNSSMPEVQPRSVTLDRSDYKSTWSTLAQSQEGAYLAVSCHTDEMEFERTGKLTVEVLERYVGISPSDTVLEIGCGVGRIGKPLSEKCARWIGTDISAEMLSYARQRLSGIQNIDFVELSSVGLKEIADNSVDVVYCAVVFMHLFEWDRYAYINEAHRVLKPGGKCYFDNVNIDSEQGWQFFMDSYSIPPNERPAHIGMISTGDELETYARRAGFEDVQIHKWDEMWVAVTGRKPEK